MHTITQRSAPHPLFRRQPSTFGPYGRIVAGALRQAWERLLTWQRRVHQRAAMAELDDRILRDVGLSRADVLLEVHKPLWRA